MASMGNEEECSEFCKEPHENIAVTMKQRVLGNALLVKEGNPSTYKIQLAEKHGEGEKTLLKYEYGNKNEAVLKEEKVIMLVGATGSGKSTLINAMANYLFGIRWKETDRLLLVDEDLAVNQAKSQTKSIVSYTIYHEHDSKVPFTVTIIDTPGFGDSEGYKRDGEISEQIKEFFTRKDGTGIDHIDAVGFVTQSSLPRLTPSQRYIFDKILSQFGKDIEDNIILLLTFADAKPPQVLSGIQEAGFKYRFHFKFNNSAIYAEKEVGGDNETFAELFWRMGEDSFAKFFDALGECEPKSLTMTQEVLEKRQLLEENVLQIDDNITLGLSKLEQLGIELKVVRQYEDEIESCKDFTYQVPEEVMSVRPSRQGVHTTNCTQCKRTCHHNCRIADDAKKARCIAMDKNSGNCKICPKHCSWKKHRNTPSITVVERKMVTKSYSELESRYKRGIEGKLSRIQILRELKKDFDVHQAKTLMLTDQNRQTVEELNAIALKPNPMSTIDYIDILIAAEEGDQQPGYMNKVLELKRIRKKTERFAQLLNRTDPFEAHRPTLEEWIEKDSDGDGTLMLLRKTLEWRQEENPEDEDPLASLRRSLEDLTMMEKDVDETLEKLRIKMNFNHRMFLNGIGRKTKRKERVAPFHKN